MRIRNKAGRNRLDGMTSGGGTGVHVGGYGSGRLVFDALEPRVLLNADVLTAQLAGLPNDTQPHDILLKMVQQAAQVGQQTQMIERVQVLDAGHDNAVLATGALSVISKVSIQGSAGGDHVTVDMDSFGAHTLPQIGISGGPDISANTLTILHGPASVPLDWQLEGAGAGSVTAQGAAAPAVSFTGIGSLEGAAGQDVLHGPAADTTWTVTGAGAGTVAGTGFSGFERLAGAVDNQDSFRFAPAAASPAGWTAAPGATTR